MEDETQFMQQQELLRVNQQAFGAAAAAESQLPSGVSSSQQRAQGFKGLELQKKHRFPFNVTSFECVGKKIVLGSDIGNLYAYQVVQAGQKQQFKLLYTESNAHPRSQIQKIVPIEQSKKRNKNTSNNSCSSMPANASLQQGNQFQNIIGQNSDEINCNNASSLLGQSSSSSFYQGFNSFSPNSDYQVNLQQQSSRQRMQSQTNNASKICSIISCGFYDRKLILWEMSNRFEKKAQSKIFKTHIYNLAIDENFVFVATFKKIYALSLNNLTDCMKFAIPDYQSRDFQISSVACLPLQNYNILIAGTDSYKGIQNFISLWQHPKDYSALQEEQNQLIEEEDMTIVQQPVVNDIEDLDNFDLDGDFNEAPAEVAPLHRKNQRVSFWKPSILECCHSSRIRQVKSIQNSPQFISVSITEINIWRVAESVCSSSSQSQIQPQISLSLLSQIPQQMSNNCFNSSPSMALKQSNELPTAQQVFSLQFNKERKIHANAVVEKETNNILMFVDSEVLSFDSTNFTLNYHQNLHSQNLPSLLYLNTAVHNNNEDTGNSQYIHNNHYVLVNNPQNTNLNAQFATKYTIAACEFEQRRRSKKQNSSSNYLMNGQQNSIQVQEFKQYDMEEDNLSRSSSNSYFQAIQESRIEEEDEELLKSPKHTPRSKKHLQSPIMKTLSQIPTSVPPVQKYSTAHIIPSTASYTILMNKLKQIEQTNNAARQHNFSSNSLRRPSQSSANIPAITFRKPLSGYPRSNSKCIKKQLKRHVKYSNKKKKMKQSLVKVFANQSTQNNQKKDINPLSLTLIQAQETAPPNQQSDFALQPFGMQQQYQQTFLQQNNSANISSNGMFGQVNTNMLSNNVSNNNNNIKHQSQKTLIIAQDSEISLGFYTIQ